MLDPGALPEAERKVLDALCARVAEAGGRALLVGGCVRDLALGLPLHELDVEVFGLSPEPLLALLRRHFGGKLVGRGFPVVKLAHRAIDVSVPRRPGPPPDADGSAAAGGSEAFFRNAAPEAGLADSARRRDFTLNALFLDPRDGRVHDPCGGLADLRARRLRHVSERFAEDPLRVLRGMQLVARFDLAPDPDTLALCRRLVDAPLPPERVFEEWRKLVLRGVWIGDGLAFLERAGWLPRFPELEALKGCPQDPRWHPEGDVWVHTRHCMDAFATHRLGDPREDLVVGLAVLTHDLGKPATTRREEDGRITSRRHAQEGLPRVRSFLGRMTAQARLVEAVVPLVAEHLAPSRLYRDLGRGPGPAGPGERRPDDRAVDAAIRRLARRVGRIDRLVRVARADHAGRPPLPAEPFEAGEWLLARAARLAVRDAAPRPLLRGRDLLRMGVPQGPLVGRILDACYEAQLEGRVATAAEAHALARELLDAEP